MTKEHEFTASDLEITEYDSAEFLTTDESIAEYLTAAMEMNDIQVLMDAINTAIRAKGMTQLAKDTGLNRQSLYKTFAKGAKPQFETVMKVFNALGVCINFQPRSTPRCQI